MCVVPESAAMVIISWLGFLIDPSAAPARIALGIISVMVGLQNYLALHEKLPPGVTSSWLGRFTMASFIFNITALVEQVLVSFGLQAQGWLKEQHTSIKNIQTWRLALLANRSAMQALFEQWDVSSDGQISKKEFRKGIDSLGMIAPAEEVNSLFDMWDTDGSGTIELRELFAALDKEAKEVKTSSEMRQSHFAMLKMQPSVASFCHGEEDAAETGA
eukprot:6291417-Prymnesium_polylepis.1